MLAPEPRPALAMGQRELIALLAFLMSLNALAIDAILPALEDMAAELAVVDGNRRQLVIGVYLVMSGVGCLVPGVLADRFGRRPIIIGALVAYAALSLVSAAVGDFAVLLWLRGVTALLAAGLSVAPAAIVRDLYAGDPMARLMSMIAAVFIFVPVIAPSIGQGVLLLGGWRWIFVMQAGCGVLGLAWVWRRLPETLGPANRQPVELSAIVRNMRTVLLERSSIGYVLATALVMGGVFGYVNSAQQLYQDNFGVGEWFPLLFGASAAMIALTNIVNSRIVMRFGARRVSHTGALVFIAVSMAQVWAAHARPGDIWWFVPLMSISLGLLGFLSANFGSIAMQPFAALAGAAASVQTFIRMLGAALVGLLIGQSYDGSARPFAFSLLLCAIGVLALVLLSERGRLFQRRNPHPA